MNRYSNKKVIVVHKQTIDWQDVHYFLLTARAGSARATAQLLGVSHTTVSRRIDHLEEDLGTRLFDRDVKGYQLTAEGEVMLRYAEQAEDVLGSAERKLHGRDSELSGSIRVTVPDVLGLELLMPNLHAFTDQYPAIDIEMLISSEVMDISGGESDIAIRIMGFGRQPPEPLIGRKLAVISSCFYAAESYLNLHDPAAEDTTACWLGWAETEQKPQWIKQSPFPDVPKRYGFNTAALQVEALKNGLGMAMLPCFVADHLQGVQRLPDCEPRLIHEVWLLSHPDHREVARLRKFREFIVDLFNRHRKSLLGE